MHLYSKDSVIVSGIRCLTLRVLHPSENVDMLNLLFEDFLQIL